MRKPNIVIIVLDTLREDHAQGLDKLVDYGFVKYQNAIAPAPWTLPSHVSMFTGLYPSEHGIHETKELRDGDEFIIYSRLRMNALEYNILQKYKDENYDTVLISANSHITPLAGFKADRNILIDPITSSIVPNDVISIIEEVKKLGGRANFILYNLRKKDIPKLLKVAQLYLIRRTHRLKAFPKYISEYFVREKGGSVAVSLTKTLRLEEPFFLFINLMESHSPYTRLGEDKDLTCAAHRWVLTGSINPQDRRFWRTYPHHAERAARRAIELVSTILQRVDRSNTLIIVTSDHGELLGDGGLHHIYSLKDGNIRVPLYVKYPEGWKKKKQKTYIPLTDIPKILDPSTDTLGSDLAIAETFGVHTPDQLFQKCGLEKPPADLFDHKIRILGIKVDILFNKTLEQVEYAKGEQAQVVLRKLLH
jgi:predicted AlkP superfamily pyrophosphatase or phosphodiesterase